MVRSTRFLHKNTEILVQDTGGTTTARTLTFLTRPDAEASVGSDLVRVIRTNHGEWVPVAKWENGRFQLMGNVSKQIEPTLENILHQYMEQGSCKTSAVKRKRYYFVEKDGAPVFSISPTHPYGLAINIYSSKIHARNAADGNADSIPPKKTRQTNDLENYLIKAADDGFAGAILDDDEPVYFCLDEKEQIIFLKLNLNTDEEVEESLLLEDGTWTPYEGDRDIEFFLDQDNFDGNMVRNLGEIPFLGHQDVDFAWTLEKSERLGTPYLLAAEDGPYQGLAGGSQIILFHNRENAMEFILDRGLFDCEAVRVEKVKDFLKDAKRKNICVLLEPFNHRAASGSMWLNEDSVILDSFSGFWEMNEDWTFTRSV